MQFLATNWIFFAAAFVFFLVLLIVNFIKAGKDAMKFNAEGFQSGMIRHVVLGLLCFLSGIPALIALVLAIIKFAQAN